MTKRDWSLLARRIAAYFIDVALLFAVYGVVQSLLFPFVQSVWDLPWETNGWLLALYVLVTISLPVWLYFIGTEQSAWRGSIGKRVLGLRVTAVTQQPLSGGQSLLRTFLKLLPWELSHFIINVPTNFWLNPSANPARLWWLAIVYALLTVYGVFVVRSPSQTLYDRWLETAVVRRS